MPSPVDTLYEAMERKYALPHHLLLWEFRNNTGFDTTRSADALAVSLYRSQGQTVTGFEIKRSRSDLLSELRQPEKAEAVGKFCDFFFLVTPDKSIASVEEIPAPWGWLCLRGPRLKVLKKAERLNAVSLDRPTLCALIYATIEKMRDVVKQSFEDEVAARVKDEHCSLQHRVECSEKSEKKLREQVTEFERVSGVKIQSYRHEPAQVGAIVRRVLDGDDQLVRYRSDLKYLALQSNRISESIAQELKDLEAERDR